MLFRRGYIYLLYHEESDSRYIGKTVDLKKRFSNHLKLQGGLHLPRNKWIKSLLDKGFEPKVQILKVCNYKDSSFYEILLIDWFKRLGFNLVNVTDGGDGTIGWKQSAETIKKRSDKLKGRPMIESTRLKIRAGYNIWKQNMPKERGEKISKSLIGNKRRQGHIPTNAWKSKLTHDQVKEIKSKLFCGFVGAKLAKEYGVSGATITAIRQGIYNLSAKERLLVKN